MSSTPTTVAPTSVRRSARLAAKPTVSYIETTEIPDEPLIERTQAMFETLLEERMNTGKFNFRGGYRKCRKDFLNLYADLPADDVERIAAETFVSKLPDDPYKHPIILKYLEAQTEKAQKEQVAVLDAKFTIAIPVIDKLLHEYNSIVSAICDIKTYACKLKKVIESDRSAAARESMRSLVYKYVIADYKKKNPKYEWLAPHIAEKMITIVKKGKISARCLYNLA